MSENPYAHHPNSPGPQEPTHYDRPERTSALAVASLVCSLICCIPGLGLLGTLLGIIAIFTIGASRGRVGGRGLAIAGTIIGLLVSGIWIALVAGSVSAFGQALRYSEFFAELEQGDVATARTYLSRSANNEVTDQEILDFYAAVEAELGDYVTGPQGLGEWIGVFEMMQGGGASMQAIQGVYPPGTGAQPMPIPLEFAQGDAVGFFVIMQGQTGGPGNLPPLENVYVELPSGSLVPLYDPATAPQGTVPPAGGAGQLPPADADAPEPAPVLEEPEPVGAGE